ncbi:hypothetical protein [Streptomyces violascens]
MENVQLVTQWSRTAHERGVLSTLIGKDPHFSANSPGLLILADKG